MTRPDSNQRLPDPRLERDRRVYTALVAVFSALTLVFGTVAAIEVAEDGHLVPVQPQGSAPIEVASPESPADAVAGGGGTGGSAPTSVGPRVSERTGSAEPPIPPGGEIVVGSVITQSGPVSFASYAGTIRAYFARLNEQGGINGRRVRLVIYDDGLDPNRSFAAYRRLVEQDNAIAIVGGFAPLGEARAVPYLEKHGVALIPGAGAYVGEEKSPVVFFLAETYAVQAEVNCREALRRGERRVGFVYVESEQTNQLIDSFQRCLARNGGQTVLDERVQVGQPDYTATALRIRQSGAQYVFVIIAPNAIPQLWRAMDRQGIRDVRTGSLYDDAIVRQYEGPASEGYLVQAENMPPHAAIPAMRDLIATVERYSPGTSLGAYAVGKWISAMIFVEAARRAGDDLTRSRILRELERTKNFTGGGLIGPITYGRGDHLGTREYVFFEKRGTSWTEPRTAG